MQPFVFVLAIKLLSGLLFLVVVPSRASSSGDVVLCDPQFPGNNTNCTCAPGHDGCSLPDCVDRCTCPGGGGCVMDICITNCICPGGGCVMDACVSNCGNGDGDGDGVGWGEATSYTCDVDAQCFEEASTCSVGTESCCGETYDSLVCKCERNPNTGGGLEYVCLFTDACLIPECEKTKTNAPAGGGSAIIISPPTNMPTDTPPAEVSSPTDAPPAEASPTDAPTTDARESVELSSSALGRMAGGIVRSTAASLASSFMLWTLMA